MQDDSTYLPSSRHQLIRFSARLIDNVNFLQVYLRQMTAEVYPGSWLRPEQPWKEKMFSGGHCVKNVEAECRLH